MIAVPHGSLQAHPVEPPADFALSHYGSIVLLRPLTPRCRRWIERNVATEGWQWFGGSLALECRYVDLLVEGMREDGLTQSTEV